MKTKLINVLKSYTENSHCNDFNLLLTMNNYLKLDDTIVNKVDYLDNFIRVSLTNRYDTILVIFYDDGDIGLTLPLSGLFIIKGNDSNMSYDEISNTLKDNNQ